jgi:hypothetical protein
LIRLRPTFIFPLGVLFDIAGSQCAEGGRLATDTLFRSRIFAIPNDCQHQFSGFSARIR